MARKVEVKYVCLSPRKCGSNTVSAVAVPPVEDGVLHRHGGWSSTGTAGVAAVGSDEPGDDE